MAQCRKLCWKEIATRLVIESGAMKNAHQRSIKNSSIETLRFQHFGHKFSSIKSFTTNEVLLAAQNLHGIMKELAIALRHEVVLDGPLQHEKYHEFTLCSGDSWKIRSRASNLGSIGLVTGWQNLQKNTSFMRSSFVCILKPASSIKDVKSEPISGSSGIAISVGRG